MKKLMLTLLIVYTAHVAKAEQLPCIAAKEKGSYLFSDMEQVGASKKMFACVRKNLICMITTQGTVIESNDFSEIRKKKTKIVFGVIQVLSGKNAPYCAYGQFLEDEMSGASWLYRLDNSTGGYGGDSTAEQNTSLTPAQFMDVLDNLNNKAP